MPFLGIQGDPENEAMLKGAFGMFVKQETEVTHLGETYKVRNGRVQVRTYLPVTAIIEVPNPKGACNVTLRIDNLVTRSQAGETPHNPRIRGQVKSNRTGEPVVYFFDDIGEFRARIDLCRRLVKAGKLAVEDLRGFLQPSEMERL